MVAFQELFSMSASPQVNMVAFKELLEQNTDKQSIVNAEPLNVWTRKDREKRMELVNELVTSPDAADWKAERDLIGGAAFEGRLNWKFRGIEYGDQPPYNQRPDGWKQHMPVEAGGNLKASDVESWEGWLASYRVAFDALLKNTALIGSIAQGESLEDTVAFRYAEVI
jgi:hypothetical protein